VGQESYYRRKGLFHARLLSLSRKNRGSYHADDLIFLGWGGPMWQITSLALIKNKTTFLGEVETAVRIGIEPQLETQSKSFWACGFLFNTF